MASKKKESRVLSLGLLCGECNRRLPIDTVNGAMPEGIISVQGNCPEHGEMGWTQRIDNFMARCLREGERVVHEEEWGEKKAGDGNGGS